jgi:hypothetical protein
MTQTTTNDNLSITHRMALVVSALAVTALYADSFAWSDSIATLWPWAQRVGVASGLSWPVFGAIVLFSAPRVPRSAWFDACLVVMHGGLAVLACCLAANTIVAASGVNVATTTLALFHAVVVLSANVVMARMFVRRARRLGILTVQALAMWCGGLNAVFVAWMLVLGG